MKSASVSTRVIWHLRPSIANVSGTSSASLGSSSRYRICNGDFISRLLRFNAAWWRLVNNCPENPEFLNGVYELVEIHRFYDIGVHAQRIARHHVTFFVGTGEHDHRNHPELLIRFDLLQHFQSIDLGQFQIEEQDGVDTIRAGPESTSAMEIIQFCRSCVNPAIWRRGARRSCDME